LHLSLLLILCQRLGTPAPGRNAGLGLSGPFSPLLRKM
jgi:hypothetical protein